MTLPVIVPPDVELWATEYLRAALADSTIFVGNVDKGGPKTQRVIVRRDGGPQLTVVTEAARLGVRVFGGTEQATSDLARLVWGFLLASPGSGPVRRARGLSGPSAVADPAGPMRYLSVELTVVGSTDLIASFGTAGYSAGY